MMRIGIVAFGSRGDVQPYVELGKGLKLAAATPDDRPRKNGTARIGAEHQIRNHGV